jgi:Phage gp6-like head-tail connector protein
MPTGDFTSLANAKSWLSNITTSTDDVLLGRLITMASVFMQNYMNRDIIAQNYTDTFDGVGGSALVVTNYPINSISSLMIDNVSVPAAANSISNGYTFNYNRITLRGYCFNRGLNNVTITYNAGFSAVPFDLEQGCIEIVGNKYRESTRIGESSKTLAGETVSFKLDDIPPTVKTIMQQYKRVFPA